MTGDASPLGVPVTRQERLPPGWTDVPSTTQRMLPGEVQSPSVYEIDAAAHHYTVVGTSTATSGITVAATSGATPYQGVRDLLFSFATTPVVVTLTKKSAALALLGAWLDEANMGVDRQQQQQLEDLKRALDAHRDPGQKLFP